MPLQRACVPVARHEAAPSRRRPAIAMSFRSLLDDGEGRELWRKSIPVMLVREPPRRPRFGATYETAAVRRADLGPRARDGKVLEHALRGRLEAPSSATSWSGCPTGRGSSSGGARAISRSGPACITPAPVTSGPRSSRSRRGPSTASSRSWTRSCATAGSRSSSRPRPGSTCAGRYQSTDFHYKVWGDEAVEDYYFYPDGFGTRVVNLKADPKNDYELSEFIILTPAGAYPFDVLPDDPVDALFLDGRKHDFRFPNPTAGDPAAERRRQEASRRSTGCDSPRTRTLAAIYFNPERDPAAAGRLRAVFRRGPDGHALLLGEPLAAGAGNSTGRQDRRPDRSSRRATTA